MGEASSNGEVELIQSQSIKRSNATRRLAEGNGMDNYTAVGIAEGFIACNEEGEYIEAWQHLINTGLAWTLQGLF